MKRSKKLLQNLVSPYFLRICLKLLFYTFSGYFSLPFFINISLRIYHNFFLTSISFNLDTLFLNWNTSFPAVTVCEIYNGEKVWDVSAQIFGEDHDQRLDDFVGEIVFFRGTCTTCENCDGDVDCPKNFDQLTEAYRSKCHELIMNCTYNNQPFDCCEEFRPIQTEYGTCYAFNSNQARKISQVQYANNRETGAGSLNFVALSDIQLHVHPPIEIPIPFSEGVIRETVLFGNIKEIVINVMEVFNHISIERLPLEERRCRFEHERTKLGNEISLYEFYSYSTCVVECMLKIHFEHCNCTSHFLVSGIKSKNFNKMCDYRGLVCLTENYYEMLEERKSCDCMSLCEEPEYDIVFNSVDEIRDAVTTNEMTHVHVALVELPKQRYLRRVTKNNLDLIISVGGIVGLFFNASLIRVVEVVFLIFECEWSSLWTMDRHGQIKRIN